MIIRCAFEQVPELCAGLVKQGVCGLPVQKRLVASG